MPWSSAGDELDKVARSHKYSMTPGQRELLEAFYSYIADWRDGHLDVDDVMELSGGSYIVMRCVAATERKHHLYNDIQRWLELHVKKHRGPGVQMGTFWFSAAEIERNGGRVVEVPDPETGELIPVAQWPSSYGTFPDGTIDHSRPIYTSQVYLPPKRVEEQEYPKPQGWAMWFADDPSRVDEN